MARKTGDPTTLVAVRFTNAELALVDEKRAKRARGGFVKTVFLDALLNGGNRHDPEPQRKASVIRPATSDLNAQCKRGNHPGWRMGLKGEPRACINCGDPEPKKAKA